MMATRLTEMPAAHPAPDEARGHCVAAGVSEIATPPVSRRGLISLNTLPYGVAARVVSVEGEGGVALRLMEMGVVPGVSVRVVKTAPFGCPMEIRVRGYNLALRRAEAEAIEVS